MITSVGDMIHACSNEDIKVYVVWTLGCHGKTIVFSKLANGNVIVFDMMYSCEVEIKPCTKKGNK